MSGDRSYLLVVDLTDGLSTLSHSPYGRLHFLKHVATIIPTSYILPEPCQVSPSRYGTYVPSLLNFGGSL